MPGRLPDPRIRDAEIRAALRDAGASKEKAARIAHASAAASTSAVAVEGGGAVDYEDWSVDDLRHRAAELGIAGRSTMRKGELIAALRRR